MKRGIAVIALCLFTPTASLADVPPPATFQVGGVNFAMQLPSGYCLPTGQHAALAQLLAATDPTNVTDVALFRCGAPVITDADDYTIIKTPVRVLTETVTRQQVLESVGAEFDKPEFAVLLKSGAIDKQVADNFNKAVPADAKFDGALRPLGRDDTCAYIGGTVAVEGKGLRYTQAVGGCITSIGGRVVLIFRYGIKTGTEDVLQLLRESKALVATIKAADK